MKKGQINLQFNWIYVLIIGAIILVGGLSIIPKLIKYSTNSYVTNVKMYIGSMLKTNQLNVQGEDLIELGGAQIEFTCDYYLIVESDLGPVPLRDIIFSPSLISGNLLGYSRYFVLPYKTEFFNFITSSNVKYILKDSPSMIGLNTSLPKNINKIVVQNYNEVDNENYDKIRYITFDNIPSVSQLGNLKKIKDKDISLLKITPLDPEFSAFSNGDLLEDRFKNEYRIYDFGKVSYYIKQENSFVLVEDVYYLDESSLIAAVYSEDPTRYKCGMQKSFENLRRTAQTKLERINQLSQIKHCPYSYPEGRLQKIIGLTSNIKHTKEFYNDLYNYGVQLIKDNKVLVKLSCPPVY